MLEFEETEREQAPMKAEVNAPAGFVVIPLEQYNELLLAAEGQHIPVKVQKTTWNGGNTIEAVIDSEWLHAVGEGLAMAKYGTEAMSDYNIVDPDSIYISSVTIAVRKPTPPSEPEEL